MKADLFSDEEPDAIKLHQDSYSPSLKTSASIPGSPSKMLNLLASFQSPMHFEKENTCTLNFNESSFAKEDLSTN